MPSPGLETDRGAGAGRLCPRTASCLGPPAWPGKAAEMKGGGAAEPRRFLPTREKSLAQAKLFDHKRREAARTAELTRWGMWQ